MKPLLAAFLAAGAVFLVIDGIWLTVMANLLYRPMIGHLIAEQFKLGPAVAFYLIYLIGLVYFGVRPGLAAQNWRAAALNGAALGFVAYGTYDLTSHAVMRDWPAALTVIDMAWGTALTALAATAGFFAARKAGG